jgi:hypothetical protein
MRQQHIEWSIIARKDKHWEKKGSIPTTMSAISQKRVIWPKLFVFFGFLAGQSLKLARVFSQH